MNQKQFGFLLKAHRMQRLIVTAPRTVSFEDVADPDCPIDGLLVRARVTAISTGTEIRVFRGIPVDDAGQFLHERVPFVMPVENGYSMVGDVIEVGEQVRGFAIGDRVYAGVPHKQIAAVAADRAFQLPDEIPDDEAVFLNILEVAHIAIRRAQPALGENVAIIGAGVIGLSALAFCRMFGFRTVVIDSDSDRLEIANAMGTDMVISINNDQFIDRTIEFFDSAGADLIIEAASDWSAIETSMEIAADDAKIVVVARHTDIPQFNPVGHPFLGKKLTLLTSYGHADDGQRWDRRRSFALTIDRLARQQLRIAPMISHHFDWQQLPEVYDRLDSGEKELVGVVIRWGD